MCSRCRRALRRAVRAAQVVALSMALTPYLAEFGARLGGMLEKGDVQALQPKEEEMKVRWSEGQKVGAWQVWRHIHAAVPSHEVVCA